MTFTQLRQEIIDRQKATGEYSEFMHLYIKASSYEDLIKLFKSITNIHWSLNNKVFDEELIKEIPEDVLIAENCVNENQIIEDPTKSVVIYGGGKIEVVVTGKNRVNVIVLNGKLIGKSTEKSMLDVKCYNNSEIEIESSDESFVSVYAFHNSKGEITQNDRSISQIILDDSANVVANVSPTSFLKANLNMDSNMYVQRKLISINNVLINKHDNATINGK